MARGRSVLVTANFERNLEATRQFLASGHGAAPFERLIERLRSHIIPSLERFPDIGADFLARAPSSVDGLALFERVVKFAATGAQVRQLIDGDYVIVYLVKGASVHLLSIKHHRQLSFDFGGHWP